MRNFIDEANKSFELIQKNFQNQMKNFEKEFCDEKPFNTFFDDFNKTRKWTNNIFDEFETDINKKMDEFSRVFPP